MKPMHREHAPLPPVFVCAIKFIFEITHSYQTWLNSYETWLNWYMTLTSRACTPAAGNSVCHDSIHSRYDLIHMRHDSYETWLNSYHTWLNSYETWLIHMRHDSFIWDMTHSYKTNESRACAAAAGIPVCHDSIHISHASFISDMTNSYETWLDLYKRWWIHRQPPPLPPVFLCVITQFIWDMTRFIWDMTGFISNMTKSYETWLHSYETRIDPHETNE